LLQAEVSIIPSKKRSKSLPLKLDVDSESILALRGKEEAPDISIPCTQLKAMINTSPTLTEKCNYELHHSTSSESGDFINLNVP